MLFFNNSLMNKKYRTSYTRKVTQPGFFDNKIKKEIFSFQW